GIGAIDEKLFCNFVGESEMTVGYSLRNWTNKKQALFNECLLSSFEGIKTLKKVKLSLDKSR
ncbi:hypothetical protein ACSVDA_21160, partial [Cytobacillus sp. Hm23]